MSNDLFLLGLLYLQYQSKLQQASTTCLQVVPFRALDPRLSAGRNNNISRPQYSCHAVMYEDNILPKPHYSTAVAGDEGIGGCQPPLCTSLISLLCAGLSSSVTIGWFVSPNSPRSLRLHGRTENANNIATYCSYDNITLPCLFLEVAIFSYH